MEWVLILSVGKCSEEKENNDETPLDTQTYLKLNITHVFILKFHYLSWCWLQELQEDEQHTSYLSFLAHTPILIVHNCANKSVCKLHKSGRFFLMQCVSQVFHKQGVKLSMLMEQTWLSIKVYFFLISMTGLFHTSRKGVK